MSHVAHVLGDPEDKRFFRTIRRAAELALRETQTRSCEVTIAIVDEAGMRQLNRRYAGADHATDVLSFESGAQDPTGDRWILGDIAVCLPVARAQAESGGHELEAELALLTVHGVLHLAGYDHAGEFDRREMWERQSAVMQRLGFAVEGWAEVE